MRYIAGCGEFEDITRVLQAWRQCVDSCLGIPFLDRPVWQSDRWCDSAGLPESIAYPKLIRDKRYLVRPVPNGNELDVKGLPVEGKRSQPQRLSESTRITLAIKHGPIVFGFDGLWKFVGY
jgi:hypothetical protein